MRSRIGILLTACLTLAVVPHLGADAHVEQRTKFQLAGVLGKVVSFFGGKAAREGITSTVSVRGDRKVTISDNNTGQIIDLAKEKLYDLDRSEEHTSELQSTSLSRMPSSA